jgi:hypothetical protein
MLRVISADLFEAVGGRPVRCIGVAALMPSAWEFGPSMLLRGLTCGSSYPRVTVRDPAPGVNGTVIVWWSGTRQGGDDLPP